MQLVAWERAEHIMIDARQHFARGDGHLRLIRVCTLEQLADGYLPPAGEDTSTNPHHLPPWTRNPAYEKLFSRRWEFTEVSAYFLGTRGVL